MTAVRSGENWTYYSARQLNPPQLGHTTDNFASFFVGKVSDIRSATSAVPPAVIVPRKTPSFSQFDPVATDEVMDLLTKVPSKTCQLDSIPTWLLKQLSDTLAPVIALCLCLTVHSKRAFFLIHSKRRSYFLV